MSNFNTFFERRFSTGIDLEKNETFLLRFAQALANRSHMIPRFVSVEKTIVASKLNGLWAKNGNIKSALQVYETEKTLINEQKLRKIVLETLDKEWDTACYLGDPGESLLSDADAFESRFMVLGFTPGSHEKWGLQFSTLFKILSHADLPVFIIPQNYDAAAWAEKKSLQFLVADDLNENESQLINTTFRLAASLEKTNILHLHVNPLSLAHLESTISAGLDPSALMGSQPVNTGELYSLMQNNLERQMHSRVIPYVHWAEQAGVTYQNVVEVGEPREEIALKIAEVKPDLVICGKHRFIHSHPFYIGQVPFQAMIKSSTPILFVP